MAEDSVIAIIKTTKNPTDCDKIQKGIRRWKGLVSKEWLNHRDNLFDRHHIDMQKLFDILTCCRQTLKSEPKNERYTTKLDDELDAAMDETKSYARLVETRCTKSVRC